ncbi:MAG: thioesterase family protein [Chloroflexota bacterium]
MDNRSMDELLKPFGFTLELPILWGYMDAMQHVNNTVYLRFFESGRIAYMDEIGKSLRVPLSASMILHSVNCRFRIPLTYPDRVTVAVRTLKIEHDRMTLEHAVISHAHQKVAAEGTCIVVAYDYEKQSKAPISENIRKRIIEFDNPQIV